MTDHTPTLPEDAALLVGGSAMPRWVFGTWQITATTLRPQATAAALEAGYRHLDTATVYGNEREVGPRLAPTAGSPATTSSSRRSAARRTGPGASARPLEQSLEALQTDHVDLWLIHWRATARSTPTCGAPSSRPGTPAWRGRSVSATSTSR